MAFSLLAVVLLGFACGNHVGDDEQELSQLSEASLAVLREIMELSAEDKQWLSDQFGAAGVPEPDDAPLPVADVPRGDDLQEPSAEEVERPVSLSAVQLYNPAKSEVEAFLIDLDGTTYEPEGILPGAKEFYEWMNATDKKFVFLSNTGAKTGTGTRDKLGGNTYLGTTLLKNKYIWTAAEAQIDAMAEKIPLNARMFVLSGFAHRKKKTGEPEPEWLSLLREKVPEKVASWTIKTAISLEEAQQWGAGDPAGRSCADDLSVPCTFVVMFVDGRLCEEDPLPAGGINPSASMANSKPVYHDDWSFELFTKVSAILGPGHAKLVYTADDAFNPDHVNRCSETGVCKDAGDVDVRKHTFPLPGPGMFAASLRKLMYPYRELGSDDPEVWVSGKGGELGKEFMYKKAFKMLEEEQRYSWKPTQGSQLAMIGDRMDTDIIGGLGAGINAILVESGAHKHTDYFYYLDTGREEYTREEDNHPLERTTFANCLADMIPDEWLKKNNKQDVKCKHE